MSYKTDLQGNNTDLQAILDMILALGLVDAPVVPEADTLDGCSWANISAIAAAGKAQNYFSVGDCKKITINGTVGTLELSNYETYVYIIGFDHNGATNTIDFGTFKTAESEGVDICLVDSQVNNASSDGTKYFNMNHGASSVSGGWKSCDLRYDVLGSTNIINDNAGTTTATNPVSGTLMAALPSELRAVMKPMTIYTDNTGTSATTESYVTPTVDYLPLLAEFEIFGVRTYANSAEKNYQMQYSYYSAGNSKVKYRHSETSQGNIWRIRSIGYTARTTSFSTVASGGTLAATNATTVSFGIAPIFRV